MPNPFKEPDLSEKRFGAWRIVAAPDADFAALRDAARGGGKTLKESKKGRVWRAGDWAVKERRSPAPAGVAAQTFRRAHYRRPWLVARHLRKHGVGTPEPDAYVEVGRLGVVTRSMVVTRYLEEHADIEHFLVALVRRGAGQDTIASFLRGVADAVNALCACGAVHHDLSGKNIFTRDGTDFVFIDLEGVTLGTPYDEDTRLKNHVQLYDSFCDHLNDVMLVPFVLRMLGDAADPRTWMPRVRKAQAERRRLIHEKWEKQGLPPRIAGVD